MRLEGNSFWRRRRPASGDASFLAGGPGFRAERRVGRRRCPITMASLAGQSLLATYFLKSPPEFMEWLPDSDRLLVVKNGTVAVYTPPLPEPVAVYPGAANRSITFLPPDYVLSLGGPKIFNVRTGTSIPLELRDSMPAAAFLSIPSRRLMVCRADHAAWNRTAFSRSMMSRAANRFH